MSEYKYLRDPEDNSIYTKQLWRPTGDIIEFRARGLQANANGKTIVDIIHHPASEAEDAYTLGSHRYNINDLQMRIRLANHSYSNLYNGLKQEFSKENFANWLFLFTNGLANYDSATITSSLVSGDPSWRPRFRAWPFILESGMTLMAARGGSTKSLSGIAMAISIDAGIDKLWPLDTSGPALLINMERSSASIAGRIGWVNEALGLPGDRPLEVFHTKGKTLQQIEGTLRKIVSQKGIEFAVLDSLSRTGLGDLTENAPANATMDMMANLFPSSLVLAHSPKHSPGEIYGSDMFRNAGDITVAVKAHRIDDDPVTWTSYQIEKANDLGVKREHWLAFEFEDDENFDSRVQISRLVDIRIPNPSEIPDFETLDKEAEQGKQRRLIIRHMSRGDYEASTGAQIARNTGIPEGTVRRELTLRSHKDGTPADDFTKIGLHWVLHTNREENH